MIDYKSIFNKDRNEDSFENNCLKNCENSIFNSKKFLNNIQKSGKFLLKMSISDKKKRT